MSTYLDESLLHLFWDMVAGRQPVVVWLELGGHHEVSQPLSLAQPVEVDVGDLPGPKVAQPALVDGGVDAEQVRGRRVLQERVPDRLQPLQVDGVVGVGHGQRLEDQAGAGALLKLGLVVQALFLNRETRATPYSCCVTTLTISY